MKSRILLAALLTTILGGASYAQYRLGLEAAQAADRLAQQARPWLLIRCRGLLPFLWGGGIAWDVDLQPTGELQRRLGLPDGYHAHVDWLWLRTLRLDDQGRPDQLNLSLYGLRAPVVETYSARLILDGHWWLAFPTLYEMNLRELRADAKLGLRYDAVTHALSLNLDLDAPQLGRLRVQQQGSAGEEIYRGDLRDLALGPATFSYTDHGVLARAQSLLAQRNGLDDDAFGIVAGASLDQYALLKGWALDSASLAALERFLRYPARLVVSLAPKQDVPVAALARHPFSEWFRMLNVHIGSPAS